MTSHAAAAFVALAFAVGTADAQQSTSPARRDSTRRDSLARAGSLEGVIIRAVRANGNAPIAQTTITTRTIERRSFAQDVPMMLQGTTPSLTAHAESGSNWGYSYLRLRGIDQTRINITLDGVPLNDMEDQVLYFANLADLMSSVQSVQVQRGAGTTGTGTASFAGSVNFETMPVARADAGGDVQLQMGSFGAQRVSASFNSGLTASNFAVYGRASALRTNGYRDHSGVMGRSAFVGGGGDPGRLVRRAAPDARSQQRRAAAWLCLVGAHFRLAQQQLSTQRGCGRHFRTRAAGLARHARRGETHGAERPVARHIVVSRRAGAGPAA